MQVYILVLDLEGRSHPNSKMKVPFDQIGCYVHKIVKNIKAFSNLEDAVTAMWSEFSLYATAFNPDEWEEELFDWWVGPYDVPASVDLYLLRKDGKERKTLSIFVEPCEMA